MGKRFVTIWLRYLKTDWFTRRNRKLSEVPFVLSAPDHGRKVIVALNVHAEAAGIFKGMVVADARAIVPSLVVLDDKPELPEKVLKALAEWCIRFTPFVAVDMPSGIILDVSGCAHLWGGEQQYLDHIVSKLKSLGYFVHAAMADTIGAAWAVSHYGSGISVVAKEKHPEALLSLPPGALRLEAETVERLYKLGLSRVADFIAMPRSALRRRFGEHILKRLHEALGNAEEIIEPVYPPEEYQERLPSLEPIRTRAGIEIALQKLLDTLCTRLQKEGKGLRKAIFKSFRIDGKIVCVEIGTNHASRNPAHLFKLFELKIDTIEPALGIDLFLLEAHRVEEVAPWQQKLWEGGGGLDSGVAELLDRVAGKIGINAILRLLPDEHYWPERSYKVAASLEEKPVTTWKLDRPRPVEVLAKPEPIEVMAPVPDYPPMSFSYKGKRHKVVKADGPERIEQEWWIEDGKHRDYYAVEDEEGKRYWLFRLGHYDAEKTYGWFMHGFFS
jgi:protein ImuB